MDSPKNFNLTGGFMFDKKKWTHEYYLKNRKEILERNKRTRNPRIYKESDRKYNKSWYLANREKRIAQTSLWRKNNQEKVRSARSKNNLRDGLRRRYGISIEQFNEMVLRQGNVCGICGNAFGNGSRDRQVDHCHKTGRIREILCINCNSGIGRFKDSPELLQKAIDYLKKWL